MNTDAEARAVPFARPPGDRKNPTRETLSLHDGYETSVYVHAPRGAERLPVVYIHGIQSHPGWFVGSAAYLADRGHPVFQVTRRGSGDNADGRGHAESDGLLLDDVDVACRFAAERTDADRVHLAGVSWGGKLATAYALDARRSTEVASLTLAAPGIVPRVDVGVVEKLSIALALLVAPQRRFDIPLSDVELFTDNEPMQTYLRGDPCRLQRATAQFLYASRCLDVKLRRAKRGSLAATTTLLLASRDRIIDNDATRRRVQRLAGGRAAVRTFDAAHTMEFEPDPTRFYEALADGVARGEA